jgi:hypothetical protein
MRVLTFICIAMIIVSCNQQQNPGSETTMSNDTAAAETRPQQKIAEEQLPITDTGQTWFRVKITRNDSAYMDYEGSWPVFFLSGNSATLQLSKSKNIMGITDIMTIYMNGPPDGKMPVVPSNREKGTASMIMSPVVDGAYGLPIILSEGFLNFTKNVDSIVSGNFEGKAVDLDKKQYQFRGYFINAKINPDKI